MKLSSTSGRKRILARHDQRSTQKNDMCEEAKDHMPPRLSPSKRRMASYNP
jgi:hypothetical protein